MRLPLPRGPVSGRCVDLLREDPASTEAVPTDPAAGPMQVDVLADDDVQLALWMLYELHYRGFEDVDPAWEWEPAQLRMRRDLERAMEADLRARTHRAVDKAVDAGGDVAEAIFALCAEDDAPAVVTYAHKRATREQLLELLMHRSVYQLKEADPHTWAIPRLSGRAKAGLVEIQYDEYGAGRADDVHQTLFANTLAACGLDPSYGAYVDDVPASTFALSNVMSMFGLHRRLRAAAVGHFAAVEATSSIPSRKMSAALSRVGFGPDATHFFDEHIEADAVHEQMAARGVCGALVEDEPEARTDVLFGAASCLLVEGLFAGAVLRSWESGRSSLYVGNDATLGDRRATA